MVRFGISRIKHRAGIKYLAVTNIALLTVLALLLVACSGTTSSQPPSPTPESPSTSDRATTTASSPIASKLQVIALTIDPVEVNPGEDVIVTAQVTNTSFARDVYDIVLLVNGRIDKTITLAMSARETTSINFLTSRDEPGNFEVTLGDRSGQFLVIRPAGSSITDSSKDTKSESNLAPNFTGIDVVTNEVSSLAQFKGSLVVLNFVNYGCSSSLNQIVSSQLKVIRDVVNERDDFVPVSVFCGCCPVDTLRDFAIDNNLNWPWILDTENTIVPQYLDYLVVHGYPTMIFIDKDQKIREATGYLDYFTLTEKIDEYN